MSAAWGSPLDPPGITGGLFTECRYCGAVVREGVYSTFAEYAAERDRHNRGPCTPTPPTPEAPTTASLVGPTPDGASPAPSGVTQLDGWDDWLRPTAMPAVLAFAAAPVLAAGLVVWFIARQFGAP